MNSMGMGEASPVAFHGALAAMKDNMRVFDAYCSMVPLYRLLLVVVQAAPDDDAVVIPCASLVESCWNGC